MFTFANKKYRSISELRVKQLADNSDYSLWRDTYGRRVVHYYERYPCFDISDFLYEDRGYHYFYVKQEDELACLYYDDGEDKIKIFDSENMPVKVFRTILNNELQSDRIDQLIGILQTILPKIKRLKKKIQGIKVPKLLQPLWKIEGEDWEVTLIAFTKAAIYGILNWIVDRYW